MNRSFFSALVWACLAAPSLVAAQPVARPDIELFPRTPPEGAARWQGTQIDLSLVTTLATLAPSLRTVPDPYVAFGVRLRPRYYLSQHFQLRASWNLTTELTNSDTTSTLHEPRASDPTLSLWFHGTPAFLGARTSFFAGVQFPVSPESRADSLILGTGFGVQFARRFDGALGRLDLIGRVGAYKAFHQFTAPGIRGDFPYSRTCGSGTTATSCGGSATGAGYNTSHAVYANLTVAPRWGWFSPGLLLAWSTSWSYAPPESSRYLPDDPTNASQSTRFAFWLDFIPSAWVTLELGYQLSRKILDADGSYGNPFFSSHGDSLLYVNATFSPEEVVRAVRGEPRGPGGIYRARSDRRDSF